MVRTITRKTSVNTAAEDPAVAVARLAQQYKQISHEEKALVQRKSDLKDQLLATAEEFGVEDEKGHRRYAMPSFEVAGKTYGQIVRQRRATKMLNEETTRSLLEDLSAERGVDLVGRVVKKVVVEEFDQDELYTLYAEDELTDKQIDSLWEEDVKYAFTMEA